MSNVKDTQIGGDHYKKMAIQPTEYIAKNGLGYIEGNIIKYISRYKSKNGLEDLKKARHYLDMLIEDLEPDEVLKSGDVVRMTHYVEPRMARVMYVNDSHVCYKYFDDDLEYMQEIEVMNQICEKT